MNQADKVALKKYREKLQMIKSGSSINPFETPEEKQAIIDRMKSGDIEFIISFLFPHYADAPPAWFHIQLIKAVIKNKTIRGLVRWGRGLAKSVVCDVFIPIILWILEDYVYLVLIGNNEKKAKQLLSDVQAEFAGNPRLIHYFGDQKLSGDWADGDFETKDGRFIGQALGMGQDARGLRKKTRRPNLVIPDDLEDKDTVKNPKRQDEIVTWIEGSLLKTMDGKTRRYLHPNNDPFPRSIQNVLEKRHPNWKLFLVKAYDKATYKPAWEGKYDKDYYKEIEEEDGILSAHAEYLHEPHIEGKIFTDDEFQWVNLPHLNHFKAIVGHWDIAYTDNEDSDYNAVRVWGLYDGSYYYIDSFVKQCIMKKAIEWMIDFDKNLPSTVSVRWQFESQFWNGEVKRTIKETEEKEEHNLYLVKVDTPKRPSKYDRIIKLKSYYQNGRMYFNKKKIGHNYTQTGLQQLKGIEPGYRTKDDAPDADEHCIKYLEKHNRATSGSMRSGRMRKNKRRRA